LIIFGILATFTGRKYFRITIGILTGGVTFLILMTIFSSVGFLNYMDPFTPTGSMISTIMSFFVALFVAGLFGLFISNMGFMLGLTVLGFVSGLLIGIILYNLLFFSSDSFILFLLLAIGLALASTYFAINYTESMIIYGTSFIGAYALVRGISMFLGKFPNEYLLYNHLKHGVGIHVPWQFYLYLLLLVILFIKGS
jgi:hypothetical protein